MRPPYQLVTDCLVFRVFLTKRCPSDLQHKQERRAARLARYEQVKRLHAQGMPAIQIARQLDLARGTVLTFLRAAAFPETPVRPRPRQIDSVSRFSA